MKFISFRIILLLLVLECTINPVYGQQVNISARLLNPSLRVFFLSDFNFSGRGTSSTEIFSLTMNNTSTADEECYLVLTIRTDNMGELANGRTAPFSLTALGHKDITNQNLFSTAQQFHLEDYSIQRAGDELKNRVLSTGKLPSDTYYFGFELYQISTGFISRAEISIRIDNPSTLDILSPGAGVGSGDPLPIFTTMPLFRWDSNLEKFRLRIAEKLPELHQTAGPEEIINDRVRFDKTFQLDRVNPGGFSSDGFEKIATTAYQYPAGGVWTMERGKTYYWQVIGLASSSGGAIEMPGEIWCFKITDFTSGSSGANTVLLNQLVLLLGDRLAAMLAAYGPLAGFTPTGNFLVNGRSLTLDEVLALIAKINSGEYVITGTSCN